MAKRKTGAVAAGTAVAAGGAIIAGKAVHDAVSNRAERKRARRFRLDPDETVCDGIGRVARGQLELAIALVEGREGAGPEATHEARKALKRVRAVLRLCRPWLGDERFGQENAILRDAGRALSGIRDAQVLVETLDGLREGCGDRVDEGTWSGFRDALAADIAVRERAGSGDRADSPVAAALVGVRERVGVWPLPEDERVVALAGGLGRIYSKARRAARRAANRPSPEHLHELRKRSKDVWHAAQLLGPALGKRSTKLRRRAHRLADVLGDDHDLTVLAERADAMPGTFAAGERELLHTVIERRQRTLRREGLRRAGKLYRRKPRKLVRRLEPA
jgi:CHAD domain-containing protein